MECVAFEYVLDLELERSSSGKSLEMQYILPMKANVFADLSLVTTKKYLWSASRQDLCNLLWKQKCSLYFYYHFRLLTYIIYFYSYIPRVKRYTYLFERSVFSQHT